MLYIAGAVACLMLLGLIDHFGISKKEGDARAICESIFHASLFICIAIFGLALELR